MSDRRRNGAEEGNVTQALRLLTDFHALTRLQVLGDDAKSPQPESEESFDDSQSDCSSDSVEDTSSRALTPKIQQPSDRFTLEELVYTKGKTKQTLCISQYDRFRLSPKV